MKGVGAVVGGAVKARAMEVGAVEAVGATDVLVEVVMSKGGIARKTRVVMRECHVGTKAA